MKKNEIDNVPVVKAEQREEEIHAKKRVGEYLLIREVGRGAFATVYEGKFSNR